MVDVTGHFAVALLFVLPAWFVYERTTASRFVALALTTAMLPDVDLFLSHYLPIQHHGITHTVAFVVVASLALGLLAAGIVAASPRKATPGETVSWLPGNVFGFATTAFFVGAGSHVFADMLSAPDIAPPVKPFMPFWNGVVSVDVLYYDDPVWNFGLLGVAIAAHLVVYALVVTRGRADDAGEAGEA